MKQLFIAIIFNIPFFANAQQTGMLYTNCSEVYDKGDTTICMEQIDDEHQLIRYYLTGKNIFSKKYQVEKNGNYSFQAVVDDFNSPKNGIGYYYYQNTQLQKVLYYQNNLLMDCAYYYDKNANPLSIGTLKNGNGTLFCYDENGLNKRVFYYKNGKINKFRTFFAKK
jgi:antitoxin component YwqK of YwqJK toxin-antitoxin module